MGKCEACGIGEGVYHVTLRLTVVGPRGQDRIKLVHFWLCEQCETANQQVMAHDNHQRERLARRMTDFPAFLSKWQAWRERHLSQSPAD